MNATTRRAKILTTCDKCEGKGWIRGFEHYADGVCFQCGGTGRCEYKTYEQAPEDPEVTARWEAKCAAVFAFIEANRHLSRAQAARKFGGVSYEKVWEIHRFVANLVGNGDRDLRPLLLGLTDRLEREAVAA